MKNNRITKNILRSLCLLLLLWTAGSCIRSGMPDCAGKSVMFTVKAYDTDNSELTTDIKDVALYVFDHNLRFIRRIETTIGSSVPIDIPEAGSINVVAWGNLGLGHEACTPVSPGESKDNCFVSLLSDTRSSSNCLSPDDLFWGEETVTRQETTTGKTISMRRKTGRMEIYITKLQEFAGFNDNDYSVAIRETPDEIDFYGRCTGNKAIYHPSGSFISRKFTVSPFNIIPEADGVNIDIYHAGLLIATISATNDNKPIVIEEGKLTSVAIDFTSSVSVTASLVPWGDATAGKIF